MAIPHVLTDREAEILARKWFAEHPRGTLKDFWHDNRANDFDRDDCEKLHEAGERILAAKKALPKNRAVQPRSKFEFTQPPEMQPREKCSSCGLMVNDTNCGCR